MNLFERYKYGFFELFGDYGGFMEITYIIGGLIMGAFTEHSFILKVLKKLYVAKTHEDLFLEPSHGSEERARMNKVTKLG